MARRDFERGLRLIGRTVAFVGRAAFVGVVAVWFLGPTRGKQHRERAVAWLRGLLGVEITRIPGREGRTDAASESATPLTSSGTERVTENAASSEERETGDDRTAEQPSDTTEEVRLAEEQQGSGLLGATLGERLSDAAEKEARANPPTSSHEGG